MKKYFLFFVLLFSLSANSQIVKIDSTRQFVQNEIIVQRLNDFHETNRISQATVGFGLACFLAGTLTGDAFKFGKINGFNVLGGAFTAFGTYIYIDSFKYLRFKDNEIRPLNKKHRKK